MRFAFTQEPLRVAFDAEVTASRPFIVEGSKRVADFANSLLSERQVRAHANAGAALPVLVRKAEKLSRLACTGEEYRAEVRAISSEALAGLDHEAMFPGPWRVTADFEVTASRPGIIEGSKHIAACANPHRPEAEVSANARAIACLPELVGLFISIGRLDTAVDLDVYAATVRQKAATVLAMLY